MKKEEYDENFKTKKEKALERAWKNRDFEIELYWKRASYFWTFIAATFAGYIALISSTNFNANLKLIFPQIEYIILCLGFIFSLAWVLVNIGSKHWHSNWENHIDLLEDDITGPVYKIVTKSLSFSVTRVNLIISRFVAVIWFILIIRYSILNITLIPKNSEGIDIVWTIMTLLTICVVILMLCSQTKTNKNEIELILRETIIKEN